jgi:hypothetical protein
MGKHTISKASLQGEKLLEYLGTFRSLVLGGRTGQDRKLSPVISHMSFRFVFDFMFAIPGTMGVLSRLLKLTV